jgi:hypothetical protein
LALGDTSACVREEEATEGFGGAEVLGLGDTAASV